MMMMSNIVVPKLHFSGLGDILNSRWGGGGALHNSHVIHTKIQKKLSVS
jgi:hypothetical protein